MITQIVLLMTWTIDVEPFEDMAQFNIIDGHLAFEVYVSLSIDKFTILVMHKVQCLKFWWYNPVIHVPLPNFNTYFHF